MNKPVRLSHRHSRWNASRQDLCFLLSAQIRRRFGCWYLKCGNDLKFVFNFEILKRHKRNSLTKGRFLHHVDSWRLKIVFPSIPNLTCRQHLFMSRRRMKCWSIYIAARRPKEGTIWVPDHIALWRLLWRWLWYGKDPAASKISEIWKCVLWEISVDIDRVDLCQADP